MAARSRSRYRAVQILYQIDVSGQSPQQAIEAYYQSLYSEEHAHKPPRDAFMEKLVYSTLERLPEIDRHIQAQAEHWRLERMSMVDRNILRVAINELLEGKTPAAVAINEALNLARRFSGEAAVPFINGVLDGVRKRLEEKKAAESA